MKKTAIALSLSALLLCQPLWASETVEPIDQTSLKSTAGGVLIGGLLAGPPGLVAGLVGGALVGELENNQETIEAQQLELSASQRQAAQHHQAYKQLLSSTRSQLTAMEEGFTFCLGFRTDSTQIEPHIASQLVSLAQMLKAFPELDMHIQAAADRRGSESYNQDLSRLRAQIVAEHLRRAGLPESRIHITYQGESAAAYEAEDLEGLGFDRIVKLTLIQGEAS
jgi:outer membrane protein OmpA-like peptidoglycan-associated protein